MTSSLASRALSISDAVPEKALRSFATVVSLLLAILLAVLNVDASLEQKLVNLRDGLLSKPASGEIHIVEIDAKSLSEIDRWPWQRSKHARLVDQLVAAGAEQIIFDVDFSSRSSPKEDRAFADALARADGKVVLPTFRQRASHGDSANDQENLPIEQFRPHVMLGSVNVLPDKAGQVNRYPYGAITGGVPRPSIAALLADRQGSVGTSFQIDQSIEIDTIPRHSFVDVMNGNFKANAFKGKRVLIGATAIEMGDRYATARFGVIPGVVIQAVAAETLIAGPIAPEFGAWPLLIVALAAMALMIKYVQRGSVTYAITSVTIAYACFFAAILLQHHRIANVEMAPVVLFAVGTYLAFFVIRILHNASIDRMTDRETGLHNLAAWRKIQPASCAHVVVVAEMQNLGAILSSSDTADARAFLKAVAERLELSCGAGNLYRIGPERFCWAIGTESSDTIEHSIEGAAALFNVPFAIGSRSVRAMLCFGVAKDAGGDPVDLVNKAALAAKRASEFGMRFLWYSEGLAQETDLSLFVVSEFDTALHAGQISVAYQPKFCLASKKVASAEALVRWRHPEKGDISPAIFVPMLEQENLLESLTLFTLEQALKDIAHWQAPHGELRCAINISASLLADTEFLEKSLAMIGASGIDPARITFELTETAVLSSLENTVSVLNRFKEAGIQLSIDDYGTGQSTLSYLKSFAADEIKIDQSFIRSVSTSQTNRIMVQSTIEMAHALGMKVVAEGVEDAQTFNLLRKLDCDTVQGWYIGKPVPTDEFVNLWCADKVFVRKAKA